MVNADKLLANYKVTAKARRDAMGLGGGGQGGSLAPAATSAQAATAAPSYPKGRCLVRGVVLDVYYGEQHLHHEARLRFKIRCENGFIVAGAVPSKLQNPRVKPGATIQILATFPEECNTPYAYFTHPALADTRYDLVKCFTRTRIRAKQ